MRGINRGVWTILLLIAVSTATRAEPGTWRAMAERDLRFVHDTIAAHHPGPLDDENPEFRAWHERGLEESLALLDGVTGYGGYRAVLSRYVAGFRDGHLNLDLHLDYKNVGWPGFMVAWRDGRVRVHHVEEGSAAPPVGSTLISCGGTPADELFAERVFRFEGLGIPADRYRLVPDILVDRFNPLVDAIESCTFEQEGEQVTVRLEWQWLRWSSIEDVWRLATNGPRGEFEIRDIAGNGVWISLPSFAPDGREMEVMKSIMADLPEHRDRDYVVLDVRRNGGGSSYWAEPFIRGLYGDGYYEALGEADEDEDDRDSHAVHRVSPENLAHFEGLLDYIRDQASEDSEFYRYFAALVVGMRQALQDGHAMYAHRYEEDDRAAEEDSERTDDAATKPLYDGKLYFLTDGTCASACLDIADGVLELPNVVHVGQPTSADTSYMEVRGVMLPSTNGRLSFATKVWRGRKRGHNEFYVPAHEWTGDIWDTSELEPWILGLSRSP